MHNVVCRPGYLYSAAFAAISVSAAQDLFEIVAGSDVTVELRKIIIGQYSDFADAEAETLSMQIVRGYTSGGSGGGTITPANLKNPAGRAASSAVERNNTTQASTSGTVLIADTWNIAAPWPYEPEPSERIIIPPSTRLVLAVTAPNDALTVNGTMIFEEFL